MRKIIIFLIIASLVGFGYVKSPKTVCERTLGYRVGEVDSRFGLSAEKVTQAIEQAEQIWEKSTGHNLFEKKDTALFSVNLVFDQRQQYANEQNQIKQPNRGQ